MSGQLEDPALHPGAHWAGVSVPGWAVLDVSEKAEFPDTNHKSNSAPRKLQPNYRDVKTAIRTFCCCSLPATSSAAITSPRAVTVLYPADAGVMSRRNIAIVYPLFDVATLQMKSLAFTLKLTCRGAKRKEVTGGWRNLRGEAVHDRQCWQRGLQHAWEAEKHTDFGRETWRNNMEVIGIDGRQY